MNLRNCHFFVHASNRYETSVRIGFGKNDMLKLVQFASATPGGTSRG
jgi:hypothetical protein